MLGVILFASAVNVFYRDVRFVVPLALQIWFYATPVIYPLSSVPDKLKPFYLLNPMVGLIDGFRKTMLQGQNPDFLALGSSAIVSLIIAILAYAYFKHVEWQFADLI
jgi:lipopolysaccharide transport system permease protein